jgi:hypothetical protein
MVRKTDQSGIHAALVRPKIASMSGAVIATAPSRACLSLVFLSLLALGQTVPSETRGQTGRSPFSGHSSSWKRENVPSVPVERSSAPFFVALNILRKSGKPRP